jgi:hypothetical protein
MWFDSDRDYAEPADADTGCADDILLGFFISWLIGLLAVLHWMVAP